MDLLLHIGTEKTGTTTIQKFLMENQEILESAGIFLPSSLGHPLHRALAAIASNDEFIDEFFQRKGLLDIAERRDAKSIWWEAFVAEVQDNNMARAIISSEHLQSRLQKSEEIFRLRSMLSSLFSSIKILIYIRDPLETALSLYSKAVKNSSVALAPPGPDDPYFNIIVNHAATIQKWAAAFGIENIKVRLFMKECFVNGDLLDDFISACDLPAAEWKRPVPQNERLSRLGLALLARLNRRLPEFGVGGVYNPERGNLDGFFEKHFNAGPPYIPEMSLVEAYEQAMSDSNEWVRERFFPERATLFPRRNPENIGPNAPVDPELDKVADLIVDIWKLRKSV